MRQKKKKPPKKTCLDNDTSVCCMQTLLELHIFMRVTVPGDIIENVSVWKGFFRVVYMEFSWIQTFLGCMCMWRLFYKCRWGTEGVGWWHGVKGEVKCYMCFTTACIPDPKMLRRSLCKCYLFSQVLGKWHPKSNLEIFLKSPNTCEGQGWELMASWKMLRNLPCGGQQLHLDFRNCSESLNFLLLLLTFFCVLSNSVRGSHKQRIQFPWKHFWF